MDDLEFIRDHSEWPGDCCCLKRKVKPSKELPFDFGVIHKSDPLCVHYNRFSIDEPMMSIRYNSLEELIQDWRVD